MSEKRQLLGGMVTFTGQDSSRPVSFFAEWQPVYPPSRPLIRVLLQLPETAVSSGTGSAMEVIDGADCPEEIIALLRGVRAYFEFQDLLAHESSIYERKPRFETDHCYYESVIYLRESLLAWLQGNDLAAMVLLRPFMELSLFHVYWHLRCHLGSFESFFKWLDGNAGKPSFKQTREFVLTNLPTDDLVDPTRVEAMSEFFSDIFTLTSSYNHTPKPEESFYMGAGTFSEEAHSPSAYYVTVAEALLRQLVYLYLFVFPMGLFPVDRVKKWGYAHGPMGLFADPSTANIIHDYIGLNFDRLRSRFSRLQTVEDLLSFYESQPDLSLVEIEDSWRSNESLGKNGRAIDHDGKLAVVKAHARSLGWTLSYANASSTITDSRRDSVMRSRTSLYDI